MTSLYDSLFEDLRSFWKKRHAPRSKRAFRCACERPIFFLNSQCLGCGAPLGYEPILGELRTLQPGEIPQTWRLTGDSTTQSDYRRCANFGSPAGCNWLVTVDEASPFYIACRLNRTLPDLDDRDNQRYCRLIEVAKRQLVSQLLALVLPVEAKTENPEHGLAFDILRSPIHTSGVDSSSYCP